MEFERVLLRAEKAFFKLNYRDAEALLQKVCSAPYSRDQWYIACNLLVCKAAQMKSLEVELANLSSDMKDIVSDCSSLIQVIQGLPLVRESMLAELAVVNCLLQVLMLLSMSTTTEDHPAIVVNKYLPCMCQRFCRYLKVSVPEFPKCISFLFQSLNSIDRFQGAMFLHICTLCAFEKLLSNCSAEASLIQAQVQRSLNCSTKEMCLIEVVTSVKEHLHLISKELLYYKAWKEYKRECYSKARNIVDSAIDSHHIQPMTDLLKGSCDAKTGRLNLALCVYRKCLSDPSLFAVPFILNNAACVFTHQGALEPAMEARELCIKTLGQLNDIEKPRWVVWCKGNTLCACPGVEELKPMIFSTALRAIQQNRTILAVSLLRLVQNGGPSLPLPSIIHLVLIQALLLSGQMEESLNVAARLISTLQVKASNSRHMELITEKCVLATTYVLAAQTTLGLWQLSAAKQLSERSMKLLDTILTSKLATTSDSTDLVRNLKVSALSILSYVYLGKGDINYSLQLLLQSVAISNTCSVSLMYNLCLLRLKCGHVIQSTNSWLKFRGLLPLSVYQAREHLKFARQHKDSDSESDNKHYMTLDMAMLQLWLRQSC